MARGYFLLKQRIRSMLADGVRPTGISVEALLNLAERGRTQLYENHLHWAKRIRRLKRAARWLWNQRQRRSTPAPRPPVAHLRATIARLEKELRAAQDLRATKELAAVMGLRLDRTAEYGRLAEADLHRQLRDVTVERDRLSAALEEFKRMLLSLAHGAAATRPSEGTAPEREP